MGGDGIAVEPQVGKAGIDGGEINMVPVEIFVDDGIGGLSWRKEPSRIVTLAAVTSHPPGLSRRWRGSLRGAVVIRGCRAETFIIGEGEVGSGEGEAIDAGDLVGEAEGIGVQAEAFEMQIHILPAPAVAFEEVDIGQFHIFEIELHDP
jgi:hypothetical protein